MKLNLTKAFVAVLALTLTFSACRKTEVKKSTSFTNQDALAKQIALSLYKSLNGQMGGTNINDGIKAPASIAPKSGKAVNDISSLCGYTIDTAYSHFSTVADTDHWMSTIFRFVYTCGTDKVNGYNCYDSVKTEDKNASFINSYTNVQYYSVVALDKSFKRVSCNGSIRALISAVVYPTASAKQVYHAVECTYYLQGLTINLSTTPGDILSGLATYTAKTHDIDSTTGDAGAQATYTGTIVFKGNYKAILTIDPKHYYTIDYSTGSITPIK